MGVERLPMQKRNDHDRQFCLQVLARAFGASCLTDQGWSESSFLTRVLHPTLFPEEQLPQRVFRDKNVRHIVDNSPVPLDRFTIVLRSAMDVLVDLKALKPVERDYCEQFMGWVELPPVAEVVSLAVPTPPELPLDSRDLPDAVILHGRFTGVA